MLLALPENYPFREPSTPGSTVKTWQDAVSLGAATLTYAAVLWCCKRFLPNIWSFLPDFERIAPHIAAFIPAVIVFFLLEKLLGG